jgi:hypothetical protein
MVVPDDGAAPGHQVDHYGRRNRRRCGCGSGVPPTHAYAPVRAHGEAGWTARLVPLTVDGLIYASPMVLPDSTRRKAAVPVLASDCSA